MPNIMAGSLNGKFSELETGQLEVVSLLVNNACNLKCKHCYLEAPNYEKFLTEDEWKQLFVSILQFNPTIMAFAGKEVFLNKKSCGLLFKAIELRDSMQSDFEKQTHIGVITNGTLLHKHKSDIIEYTPDYIDISIDGKPKVHNYIRGDNAFQMLESNLKWVVKHFSERLWITHTLMEKNILECKQFIDYYHQNYGINQFSIGIYKPRSFTDQTLTLHRNNFQQFSMETLLNLRHLKLNDPVTINIELGPEHMEYIDIFSEAGWTDTSEPISSTSHTFDNGLTLTLNVTLLREGLDKSVRISPEGYWIAAKDLIKVDEYHKVAFDNVKNYNFEAKEIYYAALKGQELI